MTSNDAYTTAHSFWGETEATNTISKLMLAIEKCGGPSRIARPSRGAVIGMLADGVSDEEILSHMNMINKGLLPNLPVNATHWLGYEPPPLPLPMREPKKIPLHFQEFPEALFWISEQCHSLGLKVSLKLKQYSKFYLHTRSFIAAVTGNGGHKNSQPQQEEDLSGENLKRRKLRSTQPSTTIHVAIDTLLFNIMIDIFSTGDKKVIPYKVLDWGDLVNFDLTELQVYKYLPTAPIAVAEETNCAKCFCLIGDRVSSTLPIYLPPAVLTHAADCQREITHEQQWRLLLEATTLEAAADVAVDVALSKVRIFELEYPFSSDIFLSIKSAIAHRFPDTAIYANSKRICVCGLGSELLYKWLREPELLYTPVPSTRLPHIWSKIIRHLVKENHCTVWCRDGERSIGYGFSITLWGAEGHGMSPAICAAVERSFHKREQLLLLASDDSPTGLFQMDKYPCRMILNGASLPMRLSQQFEGIIPLHRVGDTVRVLAISEHLGETATIISTEGNFLLLQADATAVQFTCHMSSAVKIDSTAPLPRIEIPVHPDNSIFRVEIQTWKDDTFSFVLGPPPVNITSRQRMAPDYAVDNISSLDIFSLNVRTASTTTSTTTTTTTTTTATTNIEPDNTTSTGEQTSEQPSEQPQHILSMLCAKDEQLWTPVTKIYLQSNGELLTVIGDPARREYGILIKLKTGSHISETLSRLRRLCEAVNVPHNLTDIEGELSLTLEQLVKTPLFDQAKSEYVTVLGPVSERKQAIESLNSLWRSPEKSQPGSIVLRVLPAAVTVLLRCKDAIQQSLGIAHLEVCGSGILHAVATTSAAVQELKTAVEELSLSCLRHAGKFYQKKFQQSIISSIGVIKLRKNIKQNVKKILNSSEAINYQEPAQQNENETNENPILAVTMMEQLKSLEHRRETLYQPESCPYWYRVATADIGVLVGSIVSGELPEIGENVSLQYCNGNRVPSFLSEGNAIGKVVRVSKSLIDVAFNVTTISVPPPLVKIEPNTIPLKIPRDRWTAIITDVGDCSDVHNSFHTDLVRSLSKWVQAAQTGAQNPGRPTLGYFMLQMDDGTPVTLSSPNRYAYRVNQLPDSCKSTELQMCWLALRVMEIVITVMCNFILVKILSRKTLTVLQSSCAVAFCKNLETDLAMMITELVSECQIIVDEGGPTSSIAQGFISIATAGQFIGGGETDIWSKITSAFDDTFDHRPQDMTVSGLQVLLFFFFFFFFVSLVSKKKKKKTEIIRYSLQV